MIGTLHKAKYVPVKWMVAGGGAFGGLSPPTENFSFEILVRPRFVQP